MDQATQTPPTASPHPAQTPQDERSSSFPVLEDAQGVNEPTETTEQPDAPEAEQGSRWNPFRRFFGGGAATPPSEVDEPFSSEEIVGYAQSVTLEALERTHYNLSDDEEAFLRGHFNQLVHTPEVKVTEVMDWLSVPQLLAARGWGHGSQLFKNAVKARASRLPAPVRGVAAVGVLVFNSYQKVSAIDESRKAYLRGLADARGDVAARAEQPNPQHDA